MAAGASVVTANKALLAEDGADAVRRGRPGTASTSTTRPPSPGRSRCCGRCASRWPATRCARVLGIVNGTTNYVLDKMDTTGAGFAEAVEQAQALGYAEADPTADVEGFDAAAKAAILAALAFHTRVRAADVHREGITDVTAADVASARRRWTASSSCSPSASGRADRSDGEARRRVRVHPAMIPRDPPAGRRPRRLQRRLRRGRGGRRADVLRPRAPAAQPTASAVLGDLVAVARNRVGGGRGPGRVRLRRPARPADGRAAPATTSASTSPTAPACSPRSRRSSPSTRCRSRRSASRCATGDGAATPRSSSSRTRPRRRARRDRRGAGRPRRRRRRVDSVMRVEGAE